MPEGSINLSQILMFGSPISAEYDYTDPSVASEYYTQVSVLTDFYNRLINTPATTNPTVTASDVTNINAALADLYTLAQNGLVANSTANIYPPVVTMRTYYLTNQMATNLDLLYRSFTAVGATGTPPVVTLEQLIQWKDLSVVSPVIQNILGSAVQAAASNRSLQSLVELEYVKTGSDLIADKLSGLNDALTITNNILNCLANLQDIRNRMTVTSPTGYTFPTAAMIDPMSDGVAGIHAADIMSAYRKNASLYFNQNIVPQVSPSLLQNNDTELSTAGATLYNNLLAIQRSLLAFLPKLSAVIGIPDVFDSNSLYSKIKKITGDFSALFQTGGIAAKDLATTQDKTKALKTFLLDNNVPGAFFVTGRNAGDAQANLNFGITAGQALNDQQKEDVRKFINVFEEYYKSASAVLQAITQIIEKMAQNISR